MVVFDPYYTDMFLRVLAICLILTGIHGYLGIHVLARQVIFVDLAMAQIAALGATYALLLGFDPNRYSEDVLPSYAFSLAFTLAGAAIFASTRVRHERIPQEAIIGVVYATASAAVILMLAKSPTAGEQIKHMLVGNILLVGWPTVARTAAIYLAIGVLHWMFRRTFLLITLDPSAAARAGIAVPWWDFFFYATFGVVITSSVAIGGVLLVFSFLVVPAAVGLLFADSTVGRVAVAWATGSAVSVLGIVFCFWADIPAGPAVVASFGVVLLAAGLERFVHGSSSRLVAGARLVAVMTIIAAVFYGTGFLRKAEQTHVHRSDFDALVAALASGDEARQLDALHHLEDDPDPHHVPHVVQLLGSTASDRVIEHAARVLPLFRDPRAVAALKAVAERDLDPFLKIDVGAAILRCGVPDGIPILLNVLESQESPVLRRAALDVLAEFTGRTLAYNPAATLRENRTALERWRTYWAEHGRHMEWRERLGRFH